MQLWGIDIVGGIRLVNPVTGELREAKIVTGIDDHSRFCVMAAVVERATARAVCLAFAQALARYGVPEEVISDNGKQFTDRFSRYGPCGVRCCSTRSAARTASLTGSRCRPRRTRTGKWRDSTGPSVPRSASGPFESLADAQAAVDEWVWHYNRERPHQGLDEKVPVVPADRFTPAIGPRPGAVAATGPHRRASHRGPFVCSRTRCGAANRAAALRSSSIGRAWLGEHVVVWLSVLARPAASWPGGAVLDRL